MAFMDELPWVYGAALAASATRDAAVEATASALAGGGPTTRSELVGRAIRTAIATAPAAPFDRLEPEAAEALALVRLGGLKVDEVARLIGSGAAEVKLRLAAGLRDLSAGSAPRRPLPPLDCAS
jgi:DNA-directed RNA polymerase specialized sigma24 family protein